MQIKRIIIGLIVCVGLTVQATNAYAIYSPTISKRVSIIKQHVSAARSLNGNGTITSAVESVKQQDDKRKLEGKPMALPAEAAAIIPKVLGYMFYDLMAAPYDSIFMIFNMVPSTGSVISSCLRNDIWLLEDLKDIVTQEMIKAYLLMDSNNGDLLKNDFDWLRQHIKILKEYGPRPDDLMLLYVPKVGGGNDVVYVTSNQYLFGTGPELGLDPETDPSINKYSITFPVGEGCPESDFVEAFKEVKESFETLKVLSSGRGSDWGSILTMAKARARRKAEEWIKKNQITFTIGGEEGGSPQSLVRGDSWNKFVGQMETQKKILKDMIGPITPLFSWNLYKATGEAIAVGLGADPAILNNVDYCMYYYADAGIFRACTDEQYTDYKKCQENKTEATKSGIDCDKFRNPSKSTTPIEEAENYIKQANIHKKVVEEAEHSLKYNMNLNSMSEQSLIELDRVMWEINKEIGRAYEAEGDDAGKGLPTIYTGLGSFIKKHCGGKNCG